MKKFHATTMAAASALLTATAAQAASGNYNNSNNSYNSNSYNSNSANHYNRSNYNNGYPAGNWYAGISGDVTWMNHSDTGGGGNIDLGYRFGPTHAGDFRIEAEAGYHTAGGENGFSGTHYFTYMGNLYYDFNTLMPSYASTYNGWHIVPYIGGGLGDAEVHYGHQGGSGSFIDTFHHHSSEFAYQGMAGLTFASDTVPGMDWSIGYRYLGTHQENLHSNSIEVGLRYHF